MSNFPILDLVVGMIFLYFLLSIISSSLVETVLSIFKLRAKVLTQWLVTVFDKQITQPDGIVVKFGNAIMDHCTTSALSKKGSSTSFIDAKNFVSSLLEKLTYDPKDPLKIAASLDDIMDCIKSTTLISVELQRTFLNFAMEAKTSYLAATEKTESDIQLFRKKIEHWFDSTTDRIEGTLKTKYIRPLTFWIGFIVVVALNADSVAIAKYLYNNPDARAKFAAAAAQTANDTATASVIKKLKANVTDTVAGESAIQDIKAEQLEMRKGIASLQDAMPLGWTKTEINNIKSGQESLFPKIAGLLATIMAIMLGAPFWFDLLNKVANIRSSGPKPPSSVGGEPADNK